MMKTINQRAFSRTVKETAFYFAESMLGEYQRGRLLNKSSSGASFITHQQMEVGATIYIKRPDAEKETIAGWAYRKDLAEVRWCTKKKDEKTDEWKVGVKFFSAICALCGEEIHYRDPDDLIDLCEECHNRFAAMSNGKLKAVVAHYLLGNVI
jgi:hypothetical protein